MIPEMNCVAVVVVRPTTDAEPERGQFMLVPALAADSTLEN